MPATINEYIEQYESDTYKSLNEIYKTIKAAVPNASEAMSYGMPTFKLYGKNLIHFVVSKHHIGIYPSPGAVLHFAEKPKNIKHLKEQFSYKAVSLCHLISYARSLSFESMC